MSDHERIWLQPEGRSTHPHRDNRTWCEDRQEEDDTEYIRADLIPTLPAMQSKMIRALEKRMEAADRQTNTQAATIRSMKEQHDRMGTSHMKMLNAVEVAREKLADLEKFVADKSLCAGCNVERMARDITATPRQRLEAEAKELRYALAYFIRSPSWGAATGALMESSVVRRALAENPDGN